MNFIDAVKMCLTTKFADFRGRALRSEYWYFALFIFVVELVVSIAFFNAPDIGDIVSGILALVLLLPSLAVGARRLHDIDRSGWWQLLVLVPLIGAIVLIVFFCLRGSEGENRFGPPAA